MIDVIKYKSSLELQLEALTNELKTLGIQNPNSKDDWIAVPESANVAYADPNVTADVVEDWDERRATLSQLEIRYANLKRALQKIEDGVFGVCEIGGEEIETDRLDANPAARTCKTHINEEEKLPR